MAHVSAFDDDASEVYTGVYIPDGGRGTLTDAGAIDPNESVTELTTTGAAAVTLADGTTEGQTIQIILVVDAGDATLTPASFHDGTTLTFADAGDTAWLQWRTIGGTRAWKLVFAIGAPAVA